MGFFSKLRGTIETIFQIGLGGPQLKNNGGNIEARNAADSGFVIVRGGTPVGDNDLVTKQYADTLTKPFVVQNQFNGNNPLPNNTATEQFYVTSTSGPNSTIGQLLWDDGSNAGVVQVLLALEGRTIFTAQAFVGGTISFVANAFYVWDSVSSSWLLESSSTSTGADRVIRYAITNAATQDSATKIPANAVVLRARVNVITPYSGGATISVGQPGSLTLLQLTTDNLATVAGIYEVPQETAWGGAAAVVRTTVAGAPAAGAGFVTVEYSVPDA